MDNLKLGITRSILIDLGMQFSVMMMLQQSEKFCLEESYKNLRSVRFVCFLIKGKTFSFT